MKKKQRDKGKKVKWIGIPATIVIILYLMVQLHSLFNPVEINKATEDTASDSILTTGCFIRDESLIPAVNSGTVEYTVKDGSRIKKGESLAIEYDNENALKLSSQLQELENQKEVLDSVKDSLDSSNDPEKWNQLICTQMLDLEDDVSHGVYSNVEDKTNELEEVVLKGNLSEEDSTAVNIRVTEVQDQMDKLKKQTEAATNVIYSPDSGYFSEAVDGYEKIFKASSQIDSLTLTSYQKLLAHGPQTSDASMGKIMNGFSWYFAAPVKQTDLNNLKEGESIYLRFAQISQDVPVTVYRIVHDSTGDLVILQGNMISPELLSMRKESVELVRCIYTGIKIPKDAVRMQGDQTGVYILTGAISQFEPIQIIYQGNNFYLIKPVGTNDAGVVIGDNVIVKSKDIENKRVIK